MNQYQRTIATLAERPVTSRPRRSLPIMNTPTAARTTPLASWKPTGQSPHDNGRDS